MTNETEKFKRRALKTCASAHAPFITKQPNPHCKKIRTSSINFNQTNQESVLRKYTEIDSHKLNRNNNLPTN